MQVKLTIPLAAVISIAALFGCRSHSSPYDYAENWLIREDPIRPFALKADVIYVQGFPSIEGARLPIMFAYARSEVGNKRFSGLARVFAPLISSREDFENAMKWYFRYHHPAKRAFVFIGEGECGRIMRAYEMENDEDLRKNGLVASFYTESQHKGFVNADMVRDVKKAVDRYRSRGIWGRDVSDSDTPVAPVANPDDAKNPDDSKEPKAPQKSKDAKQ